MLTMMSPLRASSPAHVFRSVAISGVAAVCIVGLLFFLDASVDHQDSGSRVMRREAPVTASPMVGPPAPLMRHEPRQIAPLATRPEAWGSYMRREPRKLMVPPAEAGQAQPLSPPVVSLESTEQLNDGLVNNPSPSDELTAGSARPEDWGHYMRREPRPVLPPVAVATRPEEWGHLMRREPRDPVAVGALAGSAVPAGAQPGRWLRPDARGLAMSGVLLVILVGFSMQAKQAIADLMAHWSGGDGQKGKAK